MAKLNPLVPILAVVGITFALNRNNGGKTGEIIGEGGEAGACPPNTSGIPNYRLAVIQEGQGEACGNCYYYTTVPSETGSFQVGFCGAFDQNVSAACLCDDWKAT